MLDVTLYKKPDGRTQVIAVANINDADADWFRANDAKVSMEDIGGQFAIYADVGTKHDDEPQEALELSRGRSCEETFSALRAQCEQMLNEQVAA